MKRKTSKQIKRELLHASGISSEHRTFFIINWPVTGRKRGKECFLLGGRKNQQALEIPAWKELFVFPPARTSKFLTLLEHDVCFKTVYFLK